MDMALQQIKYIIIIIFTMQNTPDDSLNAHIYEGKLCCAI